MRKCVFFTRALVLLAFGYLSTGAFAQCIHPFQWGSSAIPNGGSPVTNFGVYAGEYTVFTGTVSGEDYSFSSSNSGDFLTLTDGSNNVLVFGTTPITWTATFAGTVRVHVSVDSGCTTQFIGRNITAQCTTCTPPPPGPCINPWQFGSSAIPNSGSPVTNFGVWAGEYTVFTGTVAGETYTFSSSNASDWLTLTDVSNNVILFGTSPLTWTATFAGTVRVHVAVDSGCTTQFIGRNITAQCTTCTPPPPGPCINPWQFGSSAIPNSNLPTTNFGVWAGEYTVFTGTVAGETYTFSSSNASDWLTLTDVANNVILFGTSPLTWTATFSGDVRVHVAVDSGCTTQFIGRSITAQCITCPPPPPGSCIYPFSSWSSSTIPNSGAPTTNMFVFSGEYTTFLGAVAGETYTFSSSNASDWLTLTDLSNNVLVFGTSPITWTATFSGTVRVHVAVDNNCNTDFNWRDITAQCTTCTPPPPQPCIHPWQYGTSAIPNSGLPTTNFGVWAGEYTVFTGTVAGETYTFSSSNASDWLTLTDVSNNVILFGTSPLTWTATFSGDVRVHVSVDSGCTTQFIGRNITAQCITCTPPPPPGCASNFVVTPDPSCDNYPVTLSWNAVPNATGYLISLGTTPGGNEIANLLDIGNTLSVIFMNPSINTTYYYTVTPYNDGGNAVGCVEQQFTTGPVGCACVPLYNFGKIFGDLISQVTIPGTTLNNVSGTQPVNPSFTYFTGQPNYTANLVQGGTYNVTIAVGTWGNQHIRAWIDYNDDGTFDPSESIGSTVIAPGLGNTGPFPPAVFTVNLANNAPLGTHRMRIRGVWSTTPNFHTTIDPCATYAFGETEDYDITIVPPVTTQLQAGSCGATNVAPNQLLFAVNVGAPVYRFRFNGPNNGGPGWNNNTFIVDRPNRYVYFNHLIPGFQFGATYSVDVAVGDGNGNFGPYGPACNVTLQSNVPLTQIQASQCGSTVNGNTLIFANQIFDAQGYRFRISGPNDGSWQGGQFILNRPVRYFYFNNLVPGATPGGTFTVEVAYLQNDGQTYSPYGPVCNVTLNVPLNAPIIENNDIFVDNKAMSVVEFGANASHNPFTTDFGIQVLNANDVETINVSIYDMSGKLIERNAVHPMDIENARFGAKLASGMYMIEVRQGANQAVIRQVKN